MLSMFALERAGGVALRVLVPLLEATAPKTWIHVAYVGRWEGHWQGPFELTRETFAQMERNFRAVGQPVPLDWEHQTCSGGEAPAAGWIRDVRTRGDDFEVFVELTERAAEQVRRREYQYCSGVFVFGAVDAVSGDDIGAVLESVALTNVPFIKGQRPIRLSARRSAAAKGYATMDRSKLLKLLGLAEDATDETIKAAMEAALKLEAVRSGTDAGDGDADSSSAGAPQAAAPTAPAAAAASSKKPKRQASATAPGASSSVQADAKADLHAVIDQLDDATAAALLEQLMGMNADPSAPPATATSGKALATTLRALTRDNRLLSATVKELTGKVETLSTEHDTLTAEHDARAKKAVEEQVDAFIATQQKRGINLSELRQDIIDEATETPDRFGRRVQQAGGAPPVPTHRIDASSAAKAAPGKSPSEPARRAPTGRVQVQLSDTDRAWAIRCGAQMGWSPEKSLQVALGKVTARA